MYEATFENENGTSFTFGFSSGSVFDIDPLSGLDVSVSSSQGFAQVGETVTGMSVKGVKRKISGAIFDKKNDGAIARRMQRVLSTLTRGRLYVGDRYCEAIVQKTPEFVREKGGRLTFSLQVYCPMPYWYDRKETSKQLGGYFPAFSFPVNYNTHQFGVKAPSAFVNCVNEGEADVPYSATFTALATAKNVGLIDVHTLDMIKVFDTIEVGETITIAREDGHLVVRKKTPLGEVTDIFAKLDEESTLFSLRAGDNVIKATAEEGEDVLVVYVNYSSAYVGVVV
jgi:hypothetical protein